MFDVITFGAATRDVFLKSKAFRAFPDPHFKHTPEFQYQMVEEYVQWFGEKTPKVSITVQ